MSTDTLTAEARRENAAMLAAALGIDLEAAGEALQFDVAITADPADATASAIATDLAYLLGRTIRSAALGEAGEAVVLEILIGDVGAKTDGRSLRIQVGSEGAVIGGEPARERCASIPSSVRGVNKRPRVTPSPLVRSIATQTMSRLFGEPHFSGFSRFRFWPVGNPTLSASPSKTA